MNMVIVGPLIERHTRQDNLPVIVELRQGKGGWRFGEWVVGAGYRQGTAYCQLTPVKVPHRHQVGQSKQNQIPLAIGEIMNNPDTGGFHDGELNLRARLGERGERPGQRRAWKDWFHQNSGVNRNGAFQIVSTGGQTLNTTRNDLGIAAE